MSEPDDTQPLDSPTSSSPDAATPSGSSSSAVGANGDERPANGGTIENGSFASLVGVRLGDYQILRKLGRGGMADVYAARHLSLGRDVAIKVLRSDFARDKDYVSRFRREARAAAKLNHPNIVQVYDVGSFESTHFITQELIDGQNLREHLTTHGSLSPDEAIEILIAVGGALEAASEVGITHRDIKPENIMRSSRGKIKVADFGLARLGLDSDATRANLTQAGLTMGTPRYMSPEQVQGKVVDARSDLYSLGVTMYHLLAGRPPFEADEPLALAVMHLHETPQPLDRTRGKNDLPEWLIAVISRLMNKLPSDRYQSPSELLDAVRSETSVASADVYSTVGTAAATIRLQRVADLAARERRGKWMRRAALGALALACGWGAAWYASREPAMNINELLRPERATQAMSVEEQFLIAVTRDDTAAWEGISEHFPPENAKNRSYFAKSMLQLARMHVTAERYENAIDALGRLLSDPSIDRKYRLVAWLRRCQVLEKLGGGDALAEARHQFETSYNELKADNPSAIEFFERVVPEAERWQVEVGPSDS